MVLSVLVTTTSTEPEPRSGVTAVIVLAFTTTTDVALTSPNLTVAPDLNPAPEIVTVVPPTVGPRSGLMPPTTIESAARLSTVPRTPTA